MDYITAFEVLSTIIFRNILFEDSKRKYMKVIIPLSIILIFFNKYILSYVPDIAIIVIISIITITIWILSKGELIYIILQIVSTTMIMCLGEILSLPIITILQKSTSIDLKLTPIISAILIWILIAYFLDRLRKNEKLSFIYKIQNNRVTLNILINGMLVIILFKVLNDSFELTGKVAVEIAFYIILFIILNFNLFISTAKELNEKHKLQMENNFRPILEDYIHKLRANEHEYKNHLNAIYSIIQVSDEKEIKSNINKYIGNIKENNHLNNLLYVDNTILKAILYSKMSLAEEKGIYIKYDITSNLEEIDLDDMDLVVVLSNLLNNAIEGVEGSENPWINVVISELNNKDEKEYIIRVSNSVNDINQIDLSSITNKGTTTKGENRGYGLYNVKKLIKKVNGNILIEMEKDSIIIEVII
ncbi:MAG: GHKL domain-containing protein [Clostridium baratii]|uniref:sensor histidine kinase n=1 Tax=Clostridium baratii TaxID=1561 RepID=UPI00242DF9D3|nr:GHKL domain-containing protein [Clostridium baratii]MBS6005950.1 GHKL domain-containing protein [Clostridium baratii]MDU1053018.1 GHKL domain-containing protein [Clostridium baratii]